MNPSARHRMRIKDLSLQVRLGCTADERANPQEVRVGIELRFAEAPMGVESDDLKDTICYARISEALKAHVEGKEFQLVEKMAGDFYQIVRRMVEGRAESSVTVHKVRPPVGDLLGGVEYRIEDFQ
jgi:7,8-dihydroneopterin aldolase/epimerase/oxygenase